MNVLRLHESMLEALFDYDIQLQEETIIQQEKTAHADINIGFTPIISKPSKLNACNDYPVNDITPSQPNPYTEKITIQYRQISPVN